MKKNTYAITQDIVSHVSKHFKAKYCVSGMRDFLHRIGYTYKKPKLVPGKADVKVQEEFVELYKEIKQTKGVNGPIYYLDSVHPQHKSVAAYGWIKKGKVKELKSNTGHQRLSINIAINNPHKYLKLFRNEYRMSETGGHYPYLLYLHIYLQADEA